MNLQELFQPVSGVRIFGDRELPVTGLEYHSRRVSPGQIFFAIRGLEQDGNRFIPEALSRGAAAVVSESHRLRSRLRDPLPGFMSPMSAGHWP